MGTSPTPKPGPKPANSKPKLGLRAWMERVLVECDRAATGFDVDAVHDLRVALRRCRSLADGLMAIDPDSSWKEMKKAGRKLFQALGELRDMQVMAEWIEKLGGASDSTAAGDAPTLAQRTRKDGAPPALVVRARSKASAWPLATAELCLAWTGEGARPHTWVHTLGSTH